MPTATARPVEYLASSSVRGQPDEHLNGRRYPWRDWGGVAVVDSLGLSKQPHSDVAVPSLLGGARPPVAYRLQP